MKEKGGAREEAGQDSENHAHTSTGTENPYLDICAKPQRMHGADKEKDFAENPFGARVRGAEAARHPAVG